MFKQGRPCFGPPKKIIQEWKKDVCKNENENMIIIDISGRC